MEMQTDESKTEWYIPKLPPFPMPESMRLRRKLLRQRPEMIELAKKYGLCD